VCALVEAYTLRSFDSLLVRETTIEPLTRSDRLFLERLLLDREASSRHAFSSMGSWSCFGRFDESLMGQFDRWHKLFRVPKQQRRKNRCDAWVTSKFRADKTSRMAGMHGRYAKMSSKSVHDNTHLLNCSIPTTVRETVSAGFDMKDIDPSRIVDWTGGSSMLPHQSHLLEVQLVTRQPGQLVAMQRV
jgi:hypothetical protein